MSYERLLRRLRQRIFDYSDEKQDQASRLIAKCKQRLQPMWEAEAAERKREHQDRIMRLWE